MGAHENMEVAICGNQSFPKLKRLSVFSIFHCNPIQYEQKIIDNGAVKTLKRFPFKSVFPVDPASFPPLDSLLLSEYLPCPADRK